MGLVSGNDTRPVQYSSSYAVSLKVKKVEVWLDYAIMTLEDNCDSSDAVSQLKVKEVRGKGVIYYNSKASRVDEFENEYEREEEIVKETTVSPRLISRGRASTTLRLYRI
ncbi:hypothetical protein J6590_000101 [Homalodisca vitripennis]|nr:hypothetical protein J6590_000101 [Homalodisca vitripennis]